jgi:hypothetical protein
MPTTILLWVQAAVLTLSHQALVVQIPEIICIPLVAFLIMVVIRAEVFSPRGAATIGMELAVLGAGACGSIFANDTLQDRWGMALTVYGILVVLLCIFVAAVLSRIDRRNRREWEQQAKPIGPSTLAAVLHLTLGAIPMALVTALLILGYTWNPGR